MKKVLEGQGFGCSSQRVSCVKEGGMKDCMKGRETNMAARYQLALDQAPHNALKICRQLAL
jgi:hypothetical protein